MNDYLEGLVRRCGEDIDIDAIAGYAWSRIKDAASVELPDFEDLTDVQYESWKRTVREIVAIGRR